MIELLVFIVLLISAFLLAARIFIIDKARRSRYSVSLIPSAEFDPDESDVARFCSQLGRVRTSVNKVRTPRITRTIRVSLISGPQGSMAHQITVPSSAKHLLRQPNFHDVETIETAEDEIATPKHDRNGAVDTQPNKQGNRSSVRWSCLDEKKAVSNG